MDAKKGQLTTAKQALMDKSGENGARSVALSESTTEKEDKEGQNTNDETFLSETKTACETKTTEWTERKRLRTEEQASISEAIGTLSSDDARDLFHKSMPASFIQVIKKTRKYAAAGKKALTALSDTAAKSKNMRIMAMVTTLAVKVAQEPEEEEAATANPFGDVIQSVTDMITDLNNQQTSDDTKKTECEDDQLSNSQTAKTLSHSIDTNTETIDTMNAQIEESKRQIDELDSQIADLNSIQQDSDTQRAKEATEYAQAKVDDEGAIALIESSSAVLEKFYSDNQLALLQGHRQEPFTVAGEAPADAPGTWDSTYGGARGEQQGIVAILGQIKTDIEQDITDATTSEDESKQSHHELTHSITETIASCGTSKATLEGSVAADETTAANEDTSRTNSRNDLNTTIELLHTIAPDCDFMRSQHTARKDARDKELEGLGTAQTAMETANFE